MIVLKKFRKLETSDNWPSGIQIAACSPDLELHSAEFERERFSFSQRGNWRVAGGCGRALVFGFGGWARVCVCVMAVPALAGLLVVGKWKNKCSCAKSALRSWG